MSESERIFRDAQKRGIDPSGSPPGAEPRCLVVMYHYVHDTDPLPRSASLATPKGIHGLTSEKFETQLDRLCRTLEPIDWPHLYAWTQGRANLPDRCFLLTFDDGLADHARTVAPILKARGLRGVFFVPGAILVAQRLLTVHAVHLLLSILDERTLERELVDRLESLDRRDLWDALDDSAAASLYHYETPGRARIKFFVNVLLPPDMRDSIIHPLFERHIGSLSRWAGHWYLGWDDLIELQAVGHTIGGHGYAHEPYSTMTPEARGRDLRRCAAVLRNGLGPDVRPLSFPLGRFDHDICAACRGAGFAHAFTTQPAWLTAGSDVLRLPRLDTIAVDAALDAEASPCLRIQ